MVVEKPCLAMRERKITSLTGSEFHYLGHFRKEKYLSRGHNNDPMPEDKEPNRNLLINKDSVKPPTKIPNVYRGKLQPDFESGDSLPEVFDLKKPIKT